MPEAVVKNTSFGTVGEHMREAENGKCVEVTTQGMTDHRNKRMKLFIGVGAETARSRR